MRYSSSVGLGLSVVFGCLLLALIAEIYYLLWWKKRVPARELLYLFCCKKHSSLRSTGLVKDTQVHEPQASSPSPSPSSSTSSSWVRSVTQDYDDMSVETELLRLHSLCGPGPPRFLFTIKEETKEDLESEDRSKNGSRGRSLRCCLFFLWEKVCSLRTTSADICRRRGGPNVCSLQGKEGLFFYFIKTSSLLIHTQTHFHTHTHTPPSIFLLSAFITTTVTTVLR
ncbi:hypothetical protein HanRHA438_Chr07g0319541 [Helianthus annuus]|nr:hypothetical protein HanRHA438_Chr07g0319541 [Helianthus annuus]